MKTLKKLEIGCIAFSPLAQGMLSEKYLKNIPKNSRAAENSYLDKKMITKSYIQKISHLCQFTKAKANNIPYPDSMFDFIISTDIFDPEEVKRVLKPGGKFLTLLLIDEQDISPSSLAVSWSLKIESEINVTDLALAFHRAKESEAKLLYQANLIDGREMIEIINAGIKPYTKGGQHYMLKLSS